MVTGLPKSLDHYEPFEFGSDNEKTEVVIDTREARQSHRQGNEFQISSKSRTTKDVTITLIRNKSGKSKVFLNIANVTLL
jgi:hypothetical protein